MKKHILTSFWSVQHPNTGQNIQQLGLTIKACECDSNLNTIIVRVMVEHGCPFVADTNWTSIKPGLMEDKG